jgi:hypothetical protein
LAVKFCAVGSAFSVGYDYLFGDVRDPPCFEYRTTVVVEVYRVKCPECEVHATGEAGIVASTWNSEPTTNVSKAGDWVARAETVREWHLRGPCPSAPVMHTAGPTLCPRGANYRFV